MAAYTGTSAGIGLIYAEDVWRPGVAVNISSVATVSPVSVMNELESVIPLDNSPYTQNVPIAELEQNRTGTKVDSFLDDYYYRTHLTPATVDFGGIVNNVTEQFYLWNAWFSSKTCTNIDEEYPDEYEIDPDDVPFTLLPLEMKTFDVIAPLLGSTEFDAEVTFDFGTETRVLRLTGTRVCVFPFPPAFPMKETLEWLTDIMTSKDGSEQRMSLRATPRQGFNFVVLLTDEQQQAKLDALMFNWMKKTWGVPIWGELIEHTATLSSGATSITLDISDADFRDDSYAIIWQDRDNYEAVKITTIDSNGINLDVPLANTWTGLKYIMPLRLSYMISPVNWNIRADGDGDLDINFVVKENTLLDTYSAEQSYNSIPVLPASLEDGGLENTVGHDGKFEDYGLGETLLYSDSDYNIYTQKHVFRKVSKANIWAFREFLHYLYGRRNPVWILSDKTDFVLNDTIHAADTNISVDNVGWARQMTFNALRTTVAFILTDGTVMIRTITGLTESGESDIISIDTALGVELHVGDCEICLVDKCRLTEDKVEMEWTEPQEIICRTDFTKVVE